MLITSKWDMFKSILPRMLVAGGVLAGLLFGAVLAWPVSGRSQARSAQERQARALESIASSLEDMEKNQQSFYREFRQDFDRYRRCQCK